MTIITFLRLTARRVAEGGDPYEYVPNSHVIAKPVRRLVVAIRNPEIVPP